MIAFDLATQANARLSDFASFQSVGFGLRDLIGFAFDELDATGCTPRLSTAGMQLIRPGIFDQGLNKSFSGGDVERAKVLDS
jgi:hypothetical protein